MAHVGIAVLLLLVIAATGARTLCPQHCQACAQTQECPDDREYVPKPDCPTCCVVCAQKIGEACDDAEKPCANDLFCTTGKCQELPAELRASNPPIELLEYASINSSAVRFLVRLPQYSEWRDNMPPVKVTSSRSATGPWVPVPGAENAQKTRELELVASGLEGSIHLLRIELGELRSRAVRIHLPAPEATTTGHPVPAGTETCEHFGRQFMVGEGYLSTDCMQRCECVNAGNFTCAPTSSEAAAACRAAARKHQLTMTAGGFTGGISGAETLEVLDSGEETVSLKWRGPAGMVLQARALGTSGPWQRSERLTPDGTKDPVEVSFAALQPFTTYEIRAVLPGAEDGRSARLEDTPPAAVATTRPHPGQDAGFCVVLGRKIASGEEIPSPNGGCTENKCLCQPGQPPSCKQRCIVPFFRRGAFSEDALCQEKPSPDDPCCVLLQCADNQLDATEEHGMNDPCEQCADNAECHKSMIASMADEALCMCKEGYEGDPYNKKVGCKPTGISTGAKIADRMDRCVFKNTTYMPGENFTEGCEHRCTCSPEAEIVCKPRCPSLPENPGTNCKLVTDSKDECCRMYKCDGAMADAKSETSTKAGESEMCHYKNATYQRGIKFDDGCEKRCTCTEGGDVFCQPRCPPPPSSNASDDKCVTVRDPKDQCCTVVLCDVTLADQDVNKANVANLESSGDSENITNRNDEVTMVPPTKRIALHLVETVNATTARLEARLPGGAKWPTGTPSVAVFVRSSSGQWVKVPSMMVAPGSDGKLKLTVGGLEPGTAHLRVEHDDMRSEELEVELPAAAAGTTCEYKGQTYKRDDEFHDGCDMYCACTKTGVQCATIECPTDFGLDVLDPHCLDWEAEPGFVATPPRCCPDMHCRDNGSCHYMNQRFDNFAEIPTKLSGCEQRCYCEFGNVSCSPACPPVPAIPPSTLQCHSHEARLAHLPGEDCCKYWLCPQPSAGLPGNASSDSLNVTTTPAKSDAAVTSSPSNVTLDVTSHMTTSSPDMTSPMTTSSTDMTSSQMTSDLTTTPHDVISETSTDHTMTVLATEKTMMQETNTTEPLIIHTRLDSKKSDDKNQTEEFHGPFVINPDMEHKNESHEFSWPFPVRHEKEKPSAFPGPLAPHPDEKPHHREMNETEVEDSFPEKPDSRTPTGFLGPFAPHPDEKPVELPPHLVQHLGEQNETRHVEQIPDIHDSRVPSGFPGPFALHPQERPPHQHPGEVNDTRDVHPAFIPTPVPPTRKFPGPFPLDRPEHHERPVRPPFPFPGRPQQQTPPGPFLFRGEPVPGPIDGEDGPQIIGQTPDGHIIIAAQDPRNPVRVPPQRGHSQEFPYHGGQPPPFIPQRPTPGRRPGLSPIAAQIEEHLQRQQQQQQQPNQFHHPEEELYHVRPHQGRPPPGAEVYQLPADGEHFVLQDGSIVRIAPPSPGDSRQRTRPHEQTRPPGFPAQTRPHLPPHLADHTPEQVLTYVRSPSPHVNASSSAIPHDADAVSSHSLEHTASRPAPGGPGFPSRPPGPPFPPQQSGNEIQLQPPQPVGPRSVRLMFSVPPIFVGLHGRVEVQYTDDSRNDDVSTWKRAASATDDIIESPQLVHEVTGLQPATSYRVQVAIRLRDLHNVVVSQIAQFTTPPEIPGVGVQSTTLPPIIPIDAGLSIAAANSTWIRVTWRKFSEYELQFIDGIQIRYKEKEGKVYAATPLLHRLVDTYTLEDLRPGTEYEVAIFFIPFHGQNTELQAEKSVQATTGPLQADPYGFDLALTVGQVKANSVELTWDGVPYPEDKYVNIYRAIYQSDLEVGKQELSSTFKLAKRDAPHRTNVMDLKPSTRYRIWLEAYLTNGKIKKSDVRTFTTKPGSLLSAGASEQLSGKEERSDYYGALVAVAIVAALAVVGLMILVMILVRRQSAASAAITPRPAKAESAAYDNPTYKTCDDPTPVATNGASKHHNNSSAPEEP